MDLAKYKPNREFLLYKSANGDVKVDVLLQNETIWMPQKKIAELFDVQRPAITKHLKNIFDSGELNEDVVCSILELTTQHGAIKEKTQTKPQIFMPSAVLIMNIIQILQNSFLQFNQEDILNNAGKVTTEIAKAFAEKEYERYKPIQNRMFESDFDKMIKKQIESDDD